MEKLSNFVNFLKYGNMEFDTSKNFNDIIKDISNFDVFSAPEYLKIQMSLVSHSKNNSKHLNKRNDSIDIEKLDLVPSMNSISKKEIHYLNLKKEKEEASFEMKKQNDINAKKFLSERTKYDLNNPKMIVDDLEKEFFQMGILNNNKDLKKPNFRENKQNLLKNDHLAHKSNLNPSKSLNSNEFPKQIITKRIIEKEFKENLIFDNIDEIKKQKKLLEFVMLQKAKNSYLLNNQTKSFQGDFNFEKKTTQISNSTQKSFFIKNK